MTSPFTQVQHKCRRPLFYCGVRLSVRAGVVVRGREVRQSAPQEQREYRVAYFTTTLLVFVQNKLNPRARCAERAASTPEGIRWKKTKTKRKMEEGRACQAVLFVAASVKP